MFHTWKLSFVLLLRHFLVNFSTKNIGKLVSMLFSEHRSNAYEHTLTQLQFSSKHQRWNNTGLPTLNRRYSFNVVSTLFVNVEATSINKFQCWNNVNSSTLNRRNSIDLFLTLFCQRWKNVDKCTTTFIFNQISTLKQHWWALTINVASTLIQH